MSRGTVSNEQRLAASKTCAEGKMSLSEAARRLGVCWTNVREWTARYSVTAADYAMDPFGSYVVFAVAEEGGVLDLTLEESDAFTVMAEIAADEAAEGESAAVEAEAETAATEAEDAIVEETVEEAEEVASRYGRGGRGPDPGAE